MKDDETNVFHGPKAASLLTSTLDKSRLGKTMLPVSYDGYHKRCCGSLRGLVGRANYECSPGVGSLLECIRLRCEY